MVPKQTASSPGVATSAAVQPLAPVATSEATLSDALHTLRKWKYIIIIAVLLGLAYGYRKWTKQVHVFEAYGRIEIRSGSSNQFRVGGSGAMGGTDSARMSTETAIMQTDTLLLSVAKELDLPNNPIFMGGKGPHLSIDDPGIRQLMLGRLQGGLNISVVPKTDIIRISYTGLDPKVSADIVNGVIRAYIEHTLNARYDSTQRVSDWLKRQLSGLKRDIETSQQVILDMQRRLGVLAFDPTKNQVFTSLDSLSTATTSAQVNRILAESRYRSLASAAPGTVDNLLDVTAGPGGGSALSAVRAQITAAQINYLELEATLGPNHPQAKALKVQIDELQRQLDLERQRALAQSKQAYLAAAATENQVTGALDAQKATAYRMRDQLVQYTIRQREFESDRALYEGLLQRIRTASVQAGLESQEIDILDAAYPPPEASLEARSSIMTTYGIVALVMGVILAFLLENLDTGLRSVAEIEAVTGLVSLALIPRTRKSNIDPATLSLVQRNIAVLAAPKSQFAESFRALRTSLLLSTAGHPPQTILLTSATPSEGKTTVSSNLACVLAQREVRVLLIDGDLRRPTIHHRFGLNGRIGLTSVLAGTSSLDEAIQKVPDVPNLDILASGPVPPFPTEMLGSKTMLELLEACKGRYTHIVIDSPPLLSVTDGVVLSREVDAVVMIVRHGKSAKGVLRRARDLLVRAGAPLTGLILNAVEMNSPEYYGYYGYSGYSYAGVDTSSWESQAKNSDSGDGDR